MHADISGVTGQLALLETIGQYLQNSYLFLKVLIGFSIIIFVHELGHFLAAKWMGIRVDRFAVGFFYRLVGYRRGEGFTFGRRPDYTPEELEAKRYGETDYCLNALPFGGYVKMLGQDDIQIDEKTGEVHTSDDPRSFTNKPVGRRMIVVSAGVIFNMLFAFLVYVFVFLGPGTQKVAPVIGQVQPGSPAARAGLLPGDRVLAIDGDAVSSWDDISMSWALAGGAMRFEIERGGQRLSDEYIVSIRRTEGEPELIGVAPMLTNEISATADETITKAAGLQPGDRVVRVNGQKVENGLDIAMAFQECGGPDVEVVVERADPENKDTPRFVNLSVPATLVVIGAQADGPEGEFHDSKHVLGFRRRQCVHGVVPGNPAEEAGFQPGDVIAQWGNVLNPLYGEIVESIYSHDRKPVPIVVERAGKPVSLTVTPRRSLGDDKAKVGIEFAAEDRQAIVADVAPDTPAAALGMARGSEIIAIDGRPMKNWFDVFEALKASAGTTIEVRYRSGADEAVGRMAVPSSIVNELDLPPTAWIQKIDGEDSVTLKSGRKASLPDAIAVQKLLEKHVGREVTVDYAPSWWDLESRSATFHVRPDNTDPWQMRVAYAPQPMRLGFLVEPVTARGNIVRAVSMGGEQTYRDLGRVYMFVKAMLENVLTRDRGVSVKHVAGPVRIFSHAINLAEEGIGELLFFLAFISINLAVINFLPVPIVDGGLMIFLILEKIRGKPLSVKAQVITTLTGLGLIVLAFLFVTVQDLTWLFSGS